MRWLKLGRVAACTILFLYAGIGFTARALTCPPGTGSQGAASEIEEGGPDSDAASLIVKRAGRYPLNLAVFGHASDHGDASRSLATVEAQKALSRRKSRKQVTRRDSQAPGQKQATDVTEVRFVFSPRQREQPQDDVSLTVRPDGSANAVLFDYYGSKVVATYAGGLTGADVSRLRLRAKEILEEFSKLEHQSDVIIEGDLFSLSVHFRSGSPGTAGGVVQGLPPSARKAVEDLSVAWKLLRKTQPADGYVRSSIIESERLALLLREGKLRFTEVQTLPPDLRLVVRNAITNPSEFLPLSRARLEELRRYSSFGEVYVTDKGAGFSLILFTSPP